MQLTRFSVEKSSRDWLVVNERLRTVVSYEPVKIFDAT
jgi:hypothetical protein